MKIKYNGPDDARILDASDLAKADVEGFRKTRFDKGEVVEIDDAAAEGILRTPEVYGDFEEVTEQQAEEAEAEKPAKSKAKAADSGESTNTGAASTSDVPTTRPSGRASTGA